MVEQLTCKNVNLKQPEHILTVVITLEYRDKYFV